MALAGDSAKSYVEPCAGGDYEEDRSVPTYVGESRGDYVQRTTYVYVGEGAGDFELAPTEGRSFGWCCALASGAGCLLLALLALVLYMVLSSGPTSTTTPLFDCDAGFAHWTFGWSAAKRTYCCEQAGRACGPVPTEAPAPMSTTVPTTSLNRCNVGAVTEWSEEKKDYCCLHYQNGCPGTPEPAPVAAPYDCAAGFGNWRKGWSAGKKSWCCDNAGKGCATSSSLPFDCLAGLGNWERGWSVPKKAYCCEHTGKGCPSAVRPQG